MNRLNNHEKYFIFNEGDTDLLPGAYISRNEMVKIFEECKRQGKRCPVVKQVLLGITRSSLKADSFLSAASGIWTNLHNSFRNSNSSCIFQTTH